MIKNLALSLLLLVGLSLSSAAFTRSYYAEHSRLNSGTWVKVKTTGPGIHQLTYRQLRDMGFSNPSRVQVYGYPAVCDLLTNTFSTSQPDDLQPIATKHTGDKILFYGMGDCEVYATSLGKVSNNLVRTRTPYDTGSYYFLSDCENPVEVYQRSRTTAAPASSLRVFDSHLSVVFREEDSQNSALGGVIFHGKDLVPGQTYTYEFDIPDYAPFNKIEGFEDTPGSEIVFHNRVGFCSPSLQMTAASYACDDAFRISSVNDNGCYPTAALIAFRNVNQIAQLLPVELDNSEADFPEHVSVKITQPNTSQDYLAEDYQALVYPRRNRLSATSPQLLMTTPPRCTPRNQLFFPGVTAESMELWNVSNPYHIDKYPLTNTSKYDAAGGVIVTMDANTQRLVAFLPEEEFPSPEIIGRIGSQDLHSLATPEMVIIASAPLLDAAERLAELHRTYQDMDVVVVDHQKVYNEFSSGARSPMAYRRFLKMLYDRDNRLKHVLFLGQCSYDNRGVISGSDVTDRLVLWSQDDENDASNMALNYPIDARMGMLQDNYSTVYVKPLFDMQIAVGRLPITADEALGYVSKAERWFTNPVPPEVANNVVAIGGTGDGGVHLEHAQQILDTMLISNPNLNVRPLHSEMYPGSNAEYLRKAFEEGVGFFEYSGHGSKVTIENWALADTKNTTYTYPVVAMVSSCDQFAIDHDNLSFITSMLTNPNGGAIAAVAASRGVYIIHNQRSAVPFSLGYATAKPGATVGEIYRDQFNAYVDWETELPSTGYKNMLAFNLGGDPAIPLRVPAGKVVFSTINGSKADGSTRVKVESYNEATFAGYITDSEGNTDTAFNGTIKLCVFDAPRVSNTYNINGVSDYKVREVTDASVVLCEQIADVVDGKFEVSLTLPIPSRASDYNRVIATALNKEGNRAIGSTDNLSVTQIHKDQATLETLGAPEVLSMEVEVDASSAFNPEGGVAVLRAKVDPSKAGLEMRSSKVASGSSLSVDGKIRETSLRRFITSVEDGVYNLEIPVNGLEEGVHALSLTMVATNGLTTSAAETFTLLREQLSPELSVESEAVDTEAVFDLDTPCEYVQLEVADASGATVFSADNVKMPYKWNLIGKDGKAVADGQYRAVVRVRNGNAYGSGACNIVVLK